MPNVGIIDFALSPPLGILTPRLDGNGPYSGGNNVFSNWDDSGTSRPVGDTFGVVLQFNGAIPSHWGRTFGVDDGGTVVMDEFTPRLVQLAALHQLLGGAWVASQVADIVVLPFFTRWTEAIPGKIGLYVAPGIAVDAYFLRAL